MRRLFRKRAVKSPEEIEVIRYAYQIATKGMETVYRNLREGISERELAAEAVDDEVAFDVDLLEVHLFDDREVVLDEPGARQARLRLPRRRRRLLRRIPSSR